MATGITNIKSLTKLANEIITKFNLKMNPAVLKSTIMEEIHNEFDSIINGIDRFIASKPTHKTDLYEFLRTYNPICLYTYNEWQEKHYAFEYAIMMVIQEHLSLDDKTFASWFTKHITPLHDMIWSSFVSPLRERFRSVPDVPVKNPNGSVMPINNQIAVLLQIKTELTQLMLDIEQS